MNRLIVLGLLLVACGSPIDQPGEQVQEANEGDPLARSCGCGDMVEYSIPPGGCFAIADGIWGSIEDDISCFDLSVGDACSRTCTGYLEAKNLTNTPIKILASDKLTHGPAGPGLMTITDEQCERMLNGPRETDHYKNLDPFTTEANGLAVRSKGGPKATTYPTPGPSVCP